MISGRVARTKRRNFDPEWEPHSEATRSIALMFGVGLETRASLGRKMQRLPHPARLPNADEQAGDWGNASDSSS